MTEEKKEKKKHGAYKRGCTGETLEKEWERERVNKFINHALSEFSIHRDLPVSTFRSFIILRKESESI